VILSPGFREVAHAGLVTGSGPERKNLHRRSAPRHRGGGMTVEESRVVQKALGHSVA
jgi:hypothetical protein